MKTLNGIILILSGMTICSQIAVAQIFSDGFTDGDFTRDPEWIGDTEDFIVDEVNGNRVLRLQAASGQSGQSFLSTNSSGTTGFWEFWVQIDGSTPSGSNNISVVLMSDRSDLKDTFNGYMITAGETGDDVFRLFRVEEGERATELLADTTVLRRGASYHVRVDRTADGWWSLFVGEGYPGEVVSTGDSIQDLRFTESAYLGVVVQYTSTRTDDYYLDFSVDPGDIAGPPVRVDSVLLDSPTVLQLVFSEPVNAGQLAAGSVILNGRREPSFVTGDGRNWRLQFDEEIPRGENQLRLRNIRHASFNSVLEDTTIRFLRVDEPRSGDVIINEFLKDPPPGEPIPEYVELWNISDLFLGLDGWIISDATGETELNGLIEPGEMVVVSKDTLALRQYYGPGSWIQAQLPSLNNGSDQIRLETATGLLMDSLAYDPAWGGVDVALERRTPDVSSHFRANWADSPSPDYGTPGMPNLVSRDEEGPRVQELYFIAADTLLLRFSEAVMEQEIAGAEIQTDPYQAYEVIRREGHTWLLAFSEPLESGDSLLLTIRGFQDVFGNVMEFYSERVIYLEFAKAKSRSVVINEILYRRSDSESAEWIELYNPTELHYDLSGWALEDAAGNRLVMPEDVILRSGAFQVWKDREVNGPPGLFFDRFPSLNDQEEQLLLRNAEGDLIDVIAYGDETTHPEPGKSLERKDPVRSGEDVSNWEISGNTAGHSAGTMNNRFRPDTESPDLLMARRTDEGIDLIFSEFVVPDSALEVELYGDVVDSIHRTGHGNRLFIPLAEGSQISAGSEMIRIRQIADESGNRSAIMELPVSYPVQKGYLRINEIMYDPIASSTDGLPDQAEYVEIVNVSDRAVSMEGIRLHGAPDENGQIRWLEPVSSRYRWLGAGELALFHAEETAGSLPVSRTGVYFDLTEADERRALRIARNGLSLGSDGIVYLADSSGVVIDSVGYEESWHHPNIFDADGIALEKVFAAGSSSDPDNWTSSVHPSGGTPLMSNSVAQIPDDRSEKTGIRFEPDPFSPDGDGFEDHVFIHYRLDGQDYMIRVRIFDRYGRLVRNLAENKPASESGVLMWDGLTDNRQKNRVGFYVVLFEAYDIQTGRSIVFKETVVLARGFNQ